MLKDSLIRPNHSPLSSPVVLVKKKDDAWRFYVDYRELISLTVKDKFPIAIINDLIDELYEAHIFSKIDFQAGYYRLGSRRKTSTRWPSEHTRVMNSERCLSA